MDCTLLGQPFLCPCSFSGLWSDLWAQHPLQPVVTMVWRQTHGCVCASRTGGFHSASAAHRGQEGPGKTGKASLTLFTPLGTAPIPENFSALQGCSWGILRQSSAS